MIQFGNENWMKWQTKKNFVKICVWFNGKSCGSHATASAIRFELKTKLTMRSLWTWTNRRTDFVSGGRCVLRTPERDSLIQLRCWLASASRVNICIELSIYGYCVRHSDRRLYTKQQTNCCARARSLAYVCVRVMCIHVILTLGTTRINWKEGTMCANATSSPLTQAVRMRQTTPSIYRSSSSRSDQIVLHFGHYYNNRYNQPTRYIPFNEKPTIYRHTNNNMLRSAAAASAVVAATALWKSVSSDCVHVYSGTLCVWVRFDRYGLTL